MAVARADAPGCTSCLFRPLCLPPDPGWARVGLMHVALQRRAPLAMGENLFWEGDRFEALYAVRRGAVKTFATDVDGNEHIHGFYEAGDLFGLDALHESRHPTAAQALVETDICVLPYAPLALLAAAEPRLLQCLMRLMSRDLHGAQALAGGFSAEQRIAAFLVQLAWRHRQRSEPSRRVTLHMGRREIGNYLRLVTETVSRVLTHFRDQGLIGVERREILIHDFPTLARLAEPVGLASTASLIHLAV